MTGSRRWVTSSVLIQRVSWKWKAFGLPTEILRHCFSVRFFLPLECGIWTLPPTKRALVPWPIMRLVYWWLLFFYFFNYVNVSKQRVILKTETRIDRWMGYTQTHVRVQQTFAEPPNELQGSCQLEGALSLLSRQIIPTLWIRVAKKWEPELDISNSFYLRVCSCPSSHSTHIFSDDLMASSWPCPMGFVSNLFYFSLLVEKKRSSQKPKKMNLRVCEWQVDSLLLQR